MSRMCTVCNTLFDWLCQSLSLQSPQIVLRTLHPNQYLWQAPPLWWPLLQMREMRYLWTRKKSKHLTRISLFWEHFLPLPLYCLSMYTGIWIYFHDFSILKMGTLLVDGPDLLWMFMILYCLYPHPHLITQYTLRATEGDLAEPKLMHTP